MQFVKSLSVLPIFLANGLQELVVIGDDKFHSLLRVEKPRGFQEPDRVNWSPGSTEHQRLGALKNGKVLSHNTEAGTMKWRRTLDCFF